MAQDLEITVSKMCWECGCESVGSTTGIKEVTRQDVTTQGDAGMTLDMTATPEQRAAFIAGN